MERADVAAYVESELASRMSQVFVSVYGVFEDEKGELIVNVEGTLSAGDLRAVASILDRSSGRFLRRLRGWFFL